ncbi:MAG: aminotransferase class V-fold PLP-dependent enzyme [Deltaproteobacteria bacterium]|nr:aminotransferase class V-fold PLP-dependent enzyme [Deltaproteobacteria bacterium]MBN2844578.1 aminotransferase class V-fold PLP-dependent enzyme [Deltaproteobacteria bacterium]
MKRPIYMDNAATSWPKPEETLTAMATYAQSVGANPGRSGHSMSVDAGRVIFDTREAAADLFGVINPLRLIFTKNATEALNIAILGLLKPGDHVITSGMEHNSVMRPLKAMEKRGVEVSVIPCSSSGEMNPDDVNRAIMTSTRAIYLTHASNVTGTIMPISEVGTIARDKEIIFCVDAAQTAGVIPINVEEMSVDLLAFTGHKSLFGPQGTGGLYIRDGLEGKISPLTMGGTGSSSESLEHPDFLPDKFESGTPNTIGIAGLGAGIQFIKRTGIEKIRKKEQELTAMLIEGIASIPGATLYGCRDEKRQTAVISFNIEGMSPAEVALALDEEFNIMSRPGLQCAPAAHHTTGTFPGGTVRLSPGYFLEKEDVEKCIVALEALAYRGKEPHS